MLHERKKGINSFPIYGKHDLRNAMCGKLAMSRCFQIFHNFRIRLCQSGECQGQKINVSQNKRNAAVKILDRREKMLGRKISAALEKNISCPSQL